MMFRYRLIICVVVAGLLVGCATKQDFNRLERKVDILIRASDNRPTIEEIFGEQAAQISLLVDNLNAEQKRSFETLAQEYADGNLAIGEVQQKMLGVLGNNDRVVSTTRGVYVRDSSGNKLKAIPIDTKIVNCQLLTRDKIPTAIQQKKVLKRFSWGQGKLSGQTVLFPWELTISSFTKEVAEQTARRTAEEFIKMGGEKQWQRPIEIQISTEKDDQIKISTNEEDNEIYFKYRNNTPVKESSESAAVGLSNTPLKPDERVVR